MLWGNILQRKGGGMRGERGEEREEEEEGSVGVAVYELGRAPPNTKHIFMARF